MNRNLFWKALKSSNGCKFSRLKRLRHAFGYTVSVFIWCCLYETAKMCIFYNRYSCSTNTYRCKQNFRYQSSENSDALNKCMAWSFKTLNNLYLSALQNKFQFITSPWNKNLYKFKQCIHLLGRWIEKFQTSQTRISLNKEQFCLPQWVLYFISGEARFNLEDVRSLQKRNACLEEHSVRFEKCPICGGNGVYAVHS